jgi:hypothetical protein
VSVIVGLPRTGTSLLSILLGLDPNARTLKHWEAAHPIPSPTLATTAEDPRIAKNAKEVGQRLKLNPAIDPRIIWTHRDPGKVITSLVSLVNALQQMFTHRRDPALVADEWLAKSRFAMDSGMA